MEPDIELALNLFKHLCPNFTCNHLIVYKTLWRIEPKTAEFIIQESRLARATVYKVLKELQENNLIKKNQTKPVTFYAPDPIKNYQSLMQKVITKIKNGEKKIQQLIENSSGLSGELYLIHRDGGQTRIVNKQNHQTILDELELKEYKKIIEQQIIEAERKKLKPWQAIGRT